MMNVPERSQAWVRDDNGEEIGVFIYGPATVSLPNGRVVPGYKVQYPDGSRGVVPAWNVDRYQER